MWGLWLACAAPPEARSERAPVGPPAGVTSEAATAPDPDVDTWLPGPPPVEVARVLFVGDSITYGTSVEEPDRWTVGLTEDLEARFGPLEVLDLSWPGQTFWGLSRWGVPRLEEEWGPEVAGPVLVIGTLGAADQVFGRGTPAAREWSLAHLGGLLDLLQDEARFPDGATLYLANVYDQTDGTGRLDGCWGGGDRAALQAAYAAFNAATRALAEERGFAWVDAHGHFLGHGARHDDPAYPRFEPADPTFWFADCIHPDARGHLELRRLFRAAIEGAPLTRADPP